jgi:ankyrin repeat protein
MINGHEINKRPLFINNLKTQDQKLARELFKLAERYSSAFDDEKAIEEKIKELKSKGIDINVADELGLTLLHVIVKRDREGKIVKLFLYHGSNPDVQDMNDKTPLHYAVNCLNTNAIKLLLEYHANPLIKDIYGKTPAQYLKEKIQELKDLLSDMFLISLEIHD